MALKRTRPPREVQGGTERVRAAWERRVQEQVGDSDSSLGDLEQLIFLIPSYAVKIEALNKKIEKLEKEFSLLPSYALKVKELEGKLINQEKLTWLMQ